jgi:hypothetical protein
MLWEYDDFEGVAGVEINDSSLSFSCIGPKIRDPSRVPLTTKSPEDRPGIIGLGIR